MGESEKVWPLLKHSPDPRARSYLIHRLTLGTDQKKIVQRLEEEKDVSIIRALLLSLGELGEQKFSANERETVLPKLFDLFRSHPDAGLHAAAEWLLRQWKQDKRLTQIDQELAKEKAVRLVRINRQLAKN